MLQQRERKEVILKYTWSVLFFLTRPILKRKWLTRAFTCWSFTRTKPSWGERKHPTRVPSHFAVSPKGKVGRTQKNKTEKHLWRS